MGPNNISAKPTSLPVADLPTPAQSKVSSTVINDKIKINYGDEAKVNRLAVALQNVKSSQNTVSGHIEDIKSKIIM